METKKHYIPGITMGLGSLHPNTNTSSAEKLARLAYARESIHMTRVMPRWDSLSREAKLAKQDAACAILDEIYYVARNDVTPRKLFRMLTADSTLDATIAKHEEAAG